MKISKHNKKQARELQEQKKNFRAVYKGVTYTPYECFKVMAAELPPLEKEGKKLVHYDELKKIYNQHGGFEAGLGMANEYAEAVRNLVNKLISEKDGTGQFTGEAEKDNRKRPVRTADKIGKKAKERKSGGE